MHLLRNKKQFLTSGLYSDEYRLQTREKKPFCFPLPLHLGEHIISNRADFTLPRDIMEEYDLDLIVKLGDKSPLFNRIRANIFVERKSKCNEVVPIVCQCISPKEEDAMGCMDDCINRMLFYECLPNYCPCGDKCSNQRFQHKQTKKLKIFQTHNRGWGLLTLENIKQGELIIEYRGEIISHALCKERMKTIYSNQKNFYFLDYCPGEVIDAGRKGSDARFINHSCSPNCHIEKWSLRNESHLGVFASQDIEANSELFYDYNFSNFGGNVESEQICHCQSEACRGTIGKKRSQKH
ncbi:hypothetical protein BDB01DRAFT_725495 [Pilobolus umbonatus]|nr:hypothetical protein BDB01DRAFT_725495 [Pilobolus umbonatus]